MRIVGGSPRCAIGGGAGHLGSAAGAGIPTGEGIPGPGGGGWQCQRRSVSLGGGTAGGRAAIGIPCHRVGIGGKLRIEGPGRGHRHSVIQTAAAGGSVPASERVTALDRRITWC